MKVCIITLGCKVNQYESSQLVTQNIAAGHTVVQKFAPDADKYIVNACAVTAMAEKKARNLVARCRRALLARGIEPEGRVVLCGCGNDRTMNVSLDTASECGFRVTDYATQSNRSRAFIKCQDGCNNFCTYCIIPYMRGRSRSRAMDDIIAEIYVHKKPVVLTGIDLSSYGLEIGSNLKQLCHAVNGCEVKFELSSIEVGILTDDFLRAVAGCENFIPKFHVPMQSGSDKVLRDMNRKYTRAEYIDAIKRIRKYFPNARLSTDVIRGFPTETPYDVEQTNDVIKICDFTNVHEFPFSERFTSQLSRPDTSSTGPPHEKSSQVENAQKPKKR